MSNKYTYDEILAYNLCRQHFLPGDHITLSLRNEGNDSSMFQLAKRLLDCFGRSFAFFPERIAVHPDHLALIKKQGKTLDIILTEEIATIYGKRIDLQDLPRIVPLVADETLDLYTAVASFDFHEEDVRKFGEAILGMVLHSFNEDKRP